MIYRTSYETFLEYNDKPVFPLVPIWHEREIGRETPESTFHKISAGHRYAFLLESMEGDQKTARYSFVGTDPFERLVGTEDGLNRINDRGVLTLKGNPIDLMRSIMQEYRTPVVERLPRFAGGAVGYFAYDIVRHFEAIPEMNEDEINLPDLHFMIAGKMVIFDHVKQRLYVIANMLSNTADPASAYHQGMTQVDDLLNLIDQPDPIQPPAQDDSNHTDVAPGQKVQSNVRQAFFEESVRRAKEYIAAGDIFQVVLSQRFSVDIGQEPFDIYRALARLNPSPYLFYLKMDDVHIVGASPETMVLVEDRQVTLRPIAGTRKRGATPAEDAALIEELLHDPKECAEHVMLVDLGRNDVGRICEYGTVKTTELMGIEKYSHVSHIVSNVIGHLRDGIDGFDVLEATFPMGTLSGAPKIRAMEIIDELETTRRGIYGGALGYIGFSDNLDLCITIRTMVIKDGRAYIQAGAGIVADSDPETEHTECHNKAAALLRAIKETQVAS